MLRHRCLCCQCHGSFQGHVCPFQASLYLPSYGVAQGNLLFTPSFMAPKISGHLSQALTLLSASCQLSGEGDTCVVLAIAQLDLRTGRTSPILVYKPAKINPLFVRQFWEVVLESPLLFSGGKRLWSLGEGGRLMTGGCLHPSGRVFSSLPGIALALVRFGTIQRSQHPL